MRAPRFLDAATAGLLGLAVLAPRAASAAGVPGTITEDGRLFDAAGAPVAGALRVTFSIYAPENAASALWSEAQTVTFDSGYFSVELGATTAFGAGVLDGGKQW